MQFVTLTEAGNRLGGRSPEFIRGACAALGIPLIQIGQAVVMTEEHFQILKSKPALFKSEGEIKSRRRKVVAS